MVRTYAPSHCLSTHQPDAPSHWLHRGQRLPCRALCRSIFRGRRAAGQDTGDPDLGCPNATRVFEPLEVRCSEPRNGGPVELGQVPGTKRLGENERLSSFSHKKVFTVLYVCCQCMGIHHSIKKVQYQGARLLIFLPSRACNQPNSRMVFNLSRRTQKTGINLGII